MIVVAQRLKATFGDDIDGAVLVKVYGASPKGVRKAATAHESASAPSMRRTLAAVIKGPVVGAVCIGLAVGLVCRHLGVTGWQSHAIPILTMFGCYWLTVGSKNSD